MSRRADKNLDDIVKLLHERLADAANRVEPLDPVLADELRECKLDLANKIAAIALEIQMINLHVISRADAK